MQLSLFEQSVIEGIDATGTTEGTHAYVAERLALSEAERTAQVEAGRTGPVNAYKRRVRWVQQTLKHLGLAENTGRGHWQLTGKGRKSLTLLREGGMRIAFTTDGGIALWGDSRHLPKLFAGEVDLLFTSPPYPLRDPRAYGNKRDQAYIEGGKDADDPAAGTSHAERLEVPASLALHRPRGGRAAAA